MPLSNEIALVTGASRGISKAIAEVLGKRGAAVIGTATSAGGAEGISKALADAGIRGTGMVLNVTDPDSVAGVVKATAVARTLDVLPVAAHRRGPLLAEAAAHAEDEVLGRHLILLAP